jgi:GNAT superfamily N-acetyltransferase
MFTVSAADPADYPTFARLFPELEVPEPVPPPERFAAAIVPQAIFLRDGTDVVGYAWARARGDVFFVVHVIVDPRHRRRGVGRALMNALAERARAAGFARWMLNVKPENVAARALYERCGMHVAFASVSMRLEWRDAAQLPASPARTRILDPADDASFEHELRLLPREIAGFRSLPGRMILGAEHEGAAVAFAAFDPAFPGASTFRARRPEHARALLDAMRPHALPDVGHVFLFVEDDPALEAELARAGATPVMRALRMEGPISV